jgi:hypothetical protein
VHHSDCRLTLCAPVYASHYSPATRCRSKVRACHKLHALSGASQPHPLPLTPHSAHRSAQTRGRIAVRLYKQQCTKSDVDAADNWKDYQLAANKNELM